MGRPFALIWLPRPTMGREATTWSWSMYNTGIQHGHYQPETRIVDNMGIQFLPSTTTRAREVSCSDNQNDHNALHVSWRGPHQLAKHIHWNNPRTDFNQCAISKLRIRVTRKTVPSSLLHFQALLILLPLSHEKLNQANSLTNPNDSPIPWRKP